MKMVKAAALQIPTCDDKMKNIRTVGQYLEKAAPQEPDFVILPEMFNCPYQTEKFPLYAEKEEGESYQAMSAYAKEYGIYLIAGSMPEADEKGRIYNTSYVFDRQGKKIAKHRKVHLFDISISGGQSFRE